MRKSLAVTLALGLAVASTLSLNASARYGQGGGGFGWGNGQGNGYSAEALNAADVDTLAFMREEEKMARDVYLTLGEQWNIPIFANISNAEQNHMDAIETLLWNYDIPDPVVDESAIGEFTNSELATIYSQLIEEGEASLMAAFQVGALIEEIDIADLQEALASDLPSDVKTTYENLLRGSRNHLRAFVRQIEWRGVVYEAQVLDQEEVDSIVDSSMERGGRGRGGRWR